ncbi:MAG: signal peptidase II [Bdellovibrionaceae bacterium]|nr:signal peptidase II [Bdellovibrionales bacterium]MCB9084807.1 signal peptidase II [Pseudobdellovibrionaceae bacterium]
MKKRDWVFVIGLVLVVWLADRLTKAWALDAITHLQFYGPLGLVLHRNPGAILGAFSNLPPLLRVVSLSTGGAFLIFTYAAIQYLLPRRSFVLRAGMSILLGGILGNVTDRIIWGSVVDFVLLGSPHWATPAFNFADAIQWVGYFMIVGSLIKEGNQIWPNENERKRVWINPLYQWKYCLVLVFVGLGFAIISGVFSYTFLKVTIDDIIIGSPAVAEQKFLSPFLMTYMSICSGFLIMLFLIGRILSHRTAGPLYAFERFMDDVMIGKDRVLKLRQGDEFMHLEELAEKIRDRFIHEGLLKKSDHPEEIHEPEDQHVLGQESDPEESGETEAIAAIPKEAGNE